MSWIDEAIKEVEPTFYNSESRKKERLESHSIKLYTCGPTVYSYAHIGNFRTFVFEDLLRRTLALLGFEVEHVLNITDVDDKTIKGAIRDHVDLATFVAPYKKAFFEDAATLRLLPAHHNPAATEYIPQMIGMIENLVAKGIAYQGEDGSVYYAIRKFPRYGCLSHLELDQLQTGASDRMGADEYDKESASDFVLWKGYNPERDGEIYWDSLFGKGRPGWHLECSVMAMELLGETIDIHCGGVDNIFPHHENEIAQSEAASGKTFAKHWMHAEHLIVEGKKMAKSAGNFYTLRDLLEKGYSGPQVRYMLLHTHYRSPLNFAHDELEGIHTSIERLNAFVRRLQQTEHTGSGGQMGQELPSIVRAFAQSLADDLNISQALGIVFEWVRKANGLIDAHDLSADEAKKCLELMRCIDSILAVVDFEGEQVPPTLQQALVDREAARKAKDWKAADALRDKIHAAGFQIEDTPKGPQLVKV